MPSDTEEEWKRRAKGERGKRAQLKELQRQRRANRSWLMSAERSAKKREEVLRARVKRLKKELV